MSEPKTLKVRLTYFRHYGSYYSEAEYRTDMKPLDAIWAEISAMRQSRNLPGLGQNHHSDLIVLVEVPRHPHAHPRLLM